MKNLGLFFLMFMALSFNAFSQAKPQVEGQNALPKGGMQINGGLGFSGNGIPVYGGMDFGVHQDMTVGFEVGFRSYADGDWRHNAFSLAGTFNYHFNRLIGLPSNFDLYAGANVGYVNWNNRWQGPGSAEDWNDNRYSSGLGIGIQVGGRYYFNQNWGINLEFNGGNRLSGGRIGVSYRL